MSDSSDFFGDVFDDPSDDPLLGESAGSSSPDDSRSSADPQGPPSWAEGGRDESERSDSPPDQNHGPTRKHIEVDQRAGRGLDELNQAVGQGWRLVGIRLTPQNGHSDPTHREPSRFVAELEEERPQSLFDFGAT
jgi:hypothetical protein